MEGLRSNRGDKLAQIGEWLSLRGVDMLGMSETWWAESDAAAPKGFDVLAGEVVRLRPESALARRGVALLFRKGLRVTALPDNGADTPFLLGARVAGLAGGVLHVAVVYVDGASGAAAAVECELLQKWVLKYAKLGDVVVIGDFNAGPNEALLQGLLSTTGLVDAGLEGRATTRRQSRLDRTLASAGLVIKHSVDDTSPPAEGLGSYHYPTVADTSWSAARGARLDGLAEERRKPYRWRKTDDHRKELYAREVQAGLEAIPQAATGDIDLWQEAISTVLVAAADKVVGTVAPRLPEPRSPNKAVEHLTRLSNRLRRAAAKARARGESDVELRASAHQFKKLARLVARTSEDQRLERLAARMAKDGTRSMWEYVVAATRQPARLPSSVRNGEGALVFSDDEKLQALKAFWAKITNPDSAPDQQRAHQEEIHSQFLEAAMQAPADDGDERLSEPIRPAEVAAAIKALDIRKAGGADGAQSFMLKWAPDALVPVLTALFNRCWSSGRVPQAWRDAWVTLIYKRSGDRSDPGNYRPISLLPLFGRMLSSVINKRLYSLLEARGLLADNQFGFRRGRGCPEVVLALRELCELRRLDLQPTWLCFIDVTKAYDTVWREALFVKLFDMVGKSRLWSLLVDWYERDRSRIAVAGRTSPWWSNSAGVKQGDICSPVLYAIFINDIVATLRARGLGVQVSDRLRLLSILLYADDQVLIASSPEELQAMMDVVFDYSERWRFRLNHTKSAVLVYGTSQRRYPLRLWWLGADLVAERVSYRYLGVILQADGGFSEHVLSALKRGRRRLGVLRHLFLRGGRLPGRLARVLIMAHMLGILEYGAVTWACNPPACVSAVDALWKTACRAALGAPSFTHGAAVLGDLDLLPLHIRRAVLTATLYHKMAASPAGSIVAEIFSARRRQFLGGAQLPAQFTWLHQVEEALRLLGLYDHFLLLEDQDLVHGPLTRSVWRAKVMLGAKAAMREWWRAELRRHSPFMEVLARVCPDGPRRAQFIDSRSGRRKGFLAALRAGSLPLRQGAPACRYARFDAAAADDLCRLCGAEDESLVHFIFRCPTLELLRREADPFWSRISPDVEGVARVLSGFSGAPHGLQRMSACWFRMWRFRNDVLYLDADSFRLRWPGFAQPQQVLPAILPAVPPVPAVIPVPALLVLSP